MHPRLLVISLTFALAAVTACGTAPVERPRAATAATSPAAAGPAKTLPNKPHHREAGLSCADCHGETASPEAVGTDVCLRCHGTFEELAEATKGGPHDPNPHESPHYGNNQDCELCHFEHEPSENMCGDCHDWAPKVP